MQEAEAKQYIYTYNPEWESIPSYSQWLTHSPLGKYHASCKVCHSNLLVGKSGTFGLGVHSKGKKHQLRLKESRKPPSKAMLPDIYIEKMESSSQHLESGKIECKAIPNETLITHVISSHSEPASIEKKRYLYKYNPRWEINPLFSSWVTPSTKGNSFAFCKACSAELDIGSSGKSALEKHAKGKKHTDISSRPQTVKIPCESTEIMADGLNSDCEREDNSFFSNSDTAQPGSAEIKQEVKNDPNSLKKIYLLAYHAKWEEEPSFRQWLTKSTKGSGFAFCKVCRKHLNIRRGGKSDLMTHAKGQKHLKQLEVPPFKYENTYMFHDNYLVNSIRSVLPRLEEDHIQKISDYLVYDIGVEMKEDLVHVEASDFANFLKPIQARKLVSRWQKECAEDSKTITEFKHAVDMPTKTGPLDYNPFVNSSGNCPPLDDLSEVVSHAVEETQSSSPNPNISSPPITISMPYVFNLGKEFETTTVTPSNAFASFKPPTPHKTPSQDKMVQTPAKEQEEETSDSQLNVSLQKGEWVEDFAIPSESLSIELLNALQVMEKLQEPRVGELIRILADNIYKITKKPHIDDLRIISDRITQEFPCLQDPVGSSDSTYNTVFIKLRNRMYTLRKRKSRLLRKERKKMLKLSQSHSVTPIKILVNPPISL